MKKKTTKTNNALNTENETVDGVTQPKAPKTREEVQTGLDASTAAFDGETVKRDAETSEAAEIASLMSRVGTSFQFMACYVLGNLARKMVRGINGRNAGGYKTLNEMSESLRAFMIDACGEDRAARRSVPSRHTISQYAQVGFTFPSVCKRVYDAGAKCTKPETRDAAKAKAVAAIHWEFQCFIKLAIAKCGLEFDTAFTVTELNKVKAQGVKVIGDAAESGELFVALNVVNDLERQRIEAWNAENATGKTQAKLFEWSDNPAMQLKAVEYLLDPEKAERATVAKIPETCLYFDAQDSAMTGAYQQIQPSFEKTFNKKHQFLIQIIKGSCEGEDIPAHSHVVRITKGDGTKFADYPVFIEGEVEKEKNVSNHERYAAEFAADFAVELQAVESGEGETAAASMVKRWVDAREAGADKDKALAAAMPDG